MSNHMDDAQRGETRSAILLGPVLGRSSRTGTSRASAAMRLTWLALWLLVVGWTGTVAAQQQAPYPNGTSGLRAGTVPPPGEYWLMYNRLYVADRSIGPYGGPALDANGDPIDLDLSVYANVHRFIQSTDYEILGAKYAWNFVIPFTIIDVDISNYGVQESAIKMADLNVEPFVIEWHEKQYDFGYVYGFFAPTASASMTNAALPGKAHWTHYFGVAATYYFDEERTDAKVRLLPRK